MTQAELDALPECGGIALVQVEGSPWMRPVMRDDFALWDAEMHIRANGECWMVGWANGTRYKRRMQPAL